MPFIWLPISSFRITFDFKSEKTLDCINLITGCPAPELVVFSNCGPPERLSWKALFYFVHHMFYESTWVVSFIVVLHINLEMNSFLQAHIFGG